AGAGRTGERQQLVAGDRQVHVDQRRIVGATELIDLRDAGQLDHGCAAEGAGSDAALPVEPDGAEAPELSTPEVPDVPVAAAAAESPAPTRSPSRRNRSTRAGPVALRAPAAPPMFAAIHASSAMPPSVGGCDARSSAMTNTPALAASSRVCYSSYCTACTGTA